MTKIRRPATLVIAAAILLVAGSRPAAAELYRWTDVDGTTHYTTDLDGIPPGQRASAVAVGAPAPGSETAAPAAAQPRGAVIEFVPGAPMIIDAFMNGVPLRLIVDTGADRTVISEAALARAGFVAAAASPAVRIVGVTGSAVVNVVTVPMLDVAGARVGPLPVLAHTIPAGADGLLGRDVLDAFTLTVDVAANRATLVPR
jgi:aspartyl protease/uncharacterized protein DUF4124